MSGLPVEPLYTPENVDIDYERDLGRPGEFPFTRGVYPTMYRGRLWTMRQFAGFGTAEETNERFQYLLEHGQTGLSTAFDMPTLMGYDSDHPRSLGEVGARGVAIDSLDDMETLFDGIPLGEVSTSMTINSPAAILLAFYVCGRRTSRASRATELQRDDAERHPQGVHRAEGVHLPARAVDAARRRHDRVLRAASCRAGTRSRSPAITSARRARRRRRSWRSRSPTASPTWTPALERGLDVDEFAPRLSFFFNAHNDFFEEIAKFRAARRIWARELRDRYGREEPALVADALPHADRRRLADRAAAAREHRPDGDPGAGRGAGRHAVAAHELVRRGAGAADRGRGADRAAHPAGDRLRDRRRPTRSTRSAAPTSSRS